MSVSPSPSHGGRHRLSSSPGANLSMSQDGRSFRDAHASIRPMGSQYAMGSVSLGHSRAPSVPASRPISRSQSISREGKVAASPPSQSPRALSPAWSPAKQSGPSEDGVGDALMAKLRAAQVMRKQVQQDIDSTQDMTAQLRAAQDLMASSVAQVARQLDQERNERANDVEVLKQELASTKFMMAKIADKLLGGSFESTIEELKKTISVTQARQDLHAGALREGLIDMQEQKAVLKKLVDRNTAVDANGLGQTNAAGTPAVVVELRAEVAAVRTGMEAIRNNLCDQVGSLVKEMEDRLFEVTQESIAEVACQRLTEIVQAGIVGQQRDELTSLVEEHCKSLADGAEAKTLGYQEEVANALANVVQQSERQCMELVAAIEMERTARVNEAADLRSFCKAAVERLEGRQPGQPGQPNLTGQPGQAGQAGQPFGYGSSSHMGQIPPHNPQGGAPTMAQQRGLPAGHGPNLMMARPQYPPSR